jgi:hypothetical protein
VGVAGAGAATITQVTTGLDSPRGLAFLPNGTLVVAEAGHGGDVCTGGVCLGLTGRISTIDLATGSHAPLVSGLFSFLERGSATGIDGLATQGGRLLGIMGNNINELADFDCSVLAAADCKQVLAAGEVQAGALLKFTPSGTWSKIADVGGVDYQFTADNPGDGVYGTEIDANPYGVFALPGGTYVADAGSNTLDWVDNNGSVSVLNRFTVPTVHVFPTDGVPTCVAPSNNGLIVADLAGRIWRVNGSTMTLIQDQTGNHYTGCAADAAGNVYVVSMWHHTAPQLPFPPLHPNTGSIVKVAADSTASTLSLPTTLNFPNGITVSPDGMLYVSVGSTSANGGVVKIAP